MDPLPSTRPRAPGTFGNMVLGALMTGVGVFLMVVDERHTAMGAACTAFFGMTLPLFAQQAWGGEPGLVGAVARASVRVGVTGLTAGLVAVLLLSGASPGDYAFAWFVAAMMALVSVILPWRAGVLDRSRAVLAREGLLVLRADAAVLYPWATIRAVERDRFWMIPAVAVGLHADGFAKRQRFARPGLAPVKSPQTSTHEQLRERMVHQHTGADLVVWSYQSPLGVGALYAELRAAIEQSELRRDWPPAKVLVREHFGEPAPAGKGPYRRADEG